MTDKIKKVLCKIVIIFLGVCVFFIVDKGFQIRIDNQIKNYIEENYKEQCTSRQTQETTENNNTTTTSVDYKTTYEEVIDMLFPFDGNYYIPDKNAKFYSDRSCKDQYLLETPKLLSRAYQTVRRKEDDVLVNLYLLYDGTPCFSYNGLGSLQRE